MIQVCNAMTFKHVHLQGIPIAFFLFNFQSVHAHDTSQFYMCMYNVYIRLFRGTEGSTDISRINFAQLRNSFSLASKDGESAQTF